MKRKRRTVAKEEVKVRRGAEKEGNRKGRIEEEENKDTKGRKMKGKR